MLPKLFTQKRTTSNQDLLWRRVWKPTTWAIVRYCSSPRVNGWDGGRRDGEAVTMISLSDSSPTCLKCLTTQILVVRFISTVCLHRLCFRVWNLQSVYTGEIKKLKRHEAKQGRVTMEIISRAEIISRVFIKTQKILASRKAFQVPFLSNYTSKQTAFYCKSKYDMQVSLVGFHVITSKELLRSSSSDLKPGLGTWKHET